MGLLDDAIREHLDLKRRRGADPSEVERAEREALGPVRRPQAGDEDDLAPAHDEDEIFGAADDDDAFLEEPPAPSPRSEVEPESEGDWIYEDEPERLERPSDAPAEQNTALYTPDFGDDEPAAEPGPVLEPESEPAAEPRPEPRQASPRPHPAAGETFEYDAPSSPRADPLDSPVEPGAPPTQPGGEEEDVLEETPEFLQDTPDHDRLWFEQRPPKDFDFDG